MFCIFLHFCSLMRSRAMQKDTSIMAVVHGHLSPLSPLSPEKKMSDTATANGAKRFTFSVFFSELGETWLFWLRFKVVGWLVDEVSRDVYCSL